MKYGRIIDSVVQETFICEDGTTIYDYFYVTVADMFEVIPDYVEAGWYKNPDGTFSPPPPPPEDIPVTVTP